MGTLGANSTSNATASSPPIITLTSDFGSTDCYVPAMKAVLLRHCPTAQLVDVSHEVPRHDILAGSILLERALDIFPPGTVHLAVVDPGVGTSRRMMVVEINAQRVVCPDNGLITWAWRRLGRGACHELLWRPKRQSHVFHGRDIMAPVAGRIARGESIDKLSHPIHDPVLLDLAPARSRVARVIHLDHFGNATTNMTTERLRQLRARPIWVGKQNVGPIRRTYGDVAPGEPLALIGSSGLLEIAVRDGSAADLLNLQVGDAVRVGAITR